MPYWLWYNQAALRQTGQHARPTQGRAAAMPTADGRYIQGSNAQFNDRNWPQFVAWLKEVGVQKLSYYADPSAKIFQDLKAIGRAFGMPTTLLIDGNGCEIGTIAGPAEWASDDAIKLIQAALQK